MHHSKLFQLLRTLEASEIHWLHKFLKSPYHNSNQQYVKLFEYIKKYYPNLEHPKLTKEAAFKKLFPKEVFDPQKIRKLMYELTVLVEDFLVVHHLKNNAFESRKILVSELGRRNHYRAFEKETHTLLNELEQEKKRGEDHFLERYRLRKQLFGHPLTARGKDGINKLLELSEEIDNYYLWQKLSLGCSFEAGKRIYNTEVSIPPIIHSERILKNISYHITELNIYYYTYIMLKNRENESSFKKGYNVFIENEKKFDKDVKEELLRYLINYTTFRLNKGEEEYVRYTFELYKIGLENGLFIQKNRMSNNTFGSIVGSGAFLKKFEWVKQFIEKYKIYLDDISREEVLRINRANIAFQEGKFKQTVILLNSLNFKHLLYEIQSRILSIKAYFELYLEDESYYDLITAQIEAFDKFIRRDIQISTVARQSFLNFNKIIRKILQYYRKEYNLSELRELIESTTPLSTKPWLLKKIDMEE